VHEGSNGDIAADVYSMETLDLAPGEIKSVSTGIAIELPNGFGAVIEDRSGLAISGITTLAGVVDTGYRGQLSVVLVNLSKGSHRVNQGDRIAQLRLVHRIEACFEEVQELSQTERGVRGLGSSGKN
jgi:dUTP pyrophosphatase